MVVEVVIISTGSGQKFNFFKLLPGATVCYWVCYWVGCKFLEKPYLLPCYWGCYWGCYWVGYGYTGQVWSKNGAHKVPKLPPLGTQVGTAVLCVSVCECV